MPNANATDVKAKRKFPIHVLIAKEKVRSLVQYVVAMAFAIVAFVSEGAK